jgi:hypothetical protein
MMFEVCRNLGKDHVSKSSVQRDDCSRTAVTSCGERNPAGEREEDELKEMVWSEDLILAG